MTRDPRFSWIKPDALSAHKTREAERIVELRAEAERLRKNASRRGLAVPEPPLRWNATELVERFAWNPLRRERRIMPSSVLSGLVAERWALEAQIAELHEVLEPHERGAAGP